MTRSRIVKLALFPAVILVAVVTAYRVGATTNARPVVRQQFVRRLDPAAPDLVVGQFAFGLIKSNSEWKISTDVFSDPNAHWTDRDFDDGGWTNATSFGIAGYSQIYSYAERIWESQEIAPRVALRRTFDSLST